MSANEYEVGCPMPGCDELLTLTWMLSYTFSPWDLDEDSPIGLSPDDRHAMTWQVECLAGHVILLPGDTGCPCEDQEGPDCHCDQDLYDWHEDARTFRPHDSDRLRDLIHGLSPARAS